MAFGLSNATATFQRAMEHILQDLLNTIALVYIDDIIIHSTSTKEHLNSLDIVFDRLTQHGLKLKPSKCFLFKEKLNFLGHTISKDGIQKDPSKVESIKSWKQPTTVKELQRLLGLTGFLRRYIQNYATIVAPLTDLLTGYSNKKGNRQHNKKLEQTNWKWGKDQKHAFATLKKKICDDVVLAFADFSKPFRLSVDASRKGLGASLEQQQQEGKWRPIAFASRRTSSSEQNYPIHKLEFLALKWAITEKFSCYLRTSHFECYTDNNPITKFKVLTCVDEFSKYAFAIQVKSENASKTAETLYKQIYTKFGIPEVIHSDRGATFLSKVIKELNKILAIHHTVTTAYHPQSNGTCERLNNTIINRMRTLHPREKQKWHLHLDSLLFAYNSTVHESTQTSPFYVMFGRQPKIPLDLMIRLPSLQDDQPLDAKNCAAEREQELKASFELCAKNIEKRQERSKINFEKKIRKNNFSVQTYRQSNYSKVCHKEQDRR